MNGRMCVNFPGSPIFVTFGQERESLGKQVPAVCVLFRWVCFLKIFLSFYAFSFFCLNRYLGQNYFRNFNECSEGNFQN